MIFWAHSPLSLCLYLFPSLPPSPYILSLSLSLSPSLSHTYTHSCQDDSHYELTSEVRGQLKVLEKIDRINHNRKQEREKEKIMRAAKSRSKVDDPEMAAKIKEQAKQVCPIYPSFSRMAF